MRDQSYRGMRMRGHCDAHPQGNHLEGAVELFSALPGMPKEYQVR